MVIVTVGVMVKVRLSVMVRVSVSSHLEGSSTSVGRPGNCQSPVLAVENVDVRQSILLDISLGGIHYRSCTGRASARGPGWPATHGPGRARLQGYFAGRAGCGPETCRPGPGLVNNNFAGCGPGLGLTFPGLGRARAYSESHSCFNIMVKHYPQLSIAMRALFSTL